MNKRSISFQKAISTCSLYLIVVSDQVIGSIHLNEYNTITNIDINSDYLHNIKDILIPMLLFELGLNGIELICDQAFYEYYNELGFNKRYNTDNNRVILRYEVR